MAASSIPSLYCLDNGFATTDERLLSSPMEFEMGAKADALRGELRRLIAENIPPDYLGAFTDDPADLEVAQGFCRLLAAHGLLCMSWPEEFGGKDSSPWEQTVV